MLEKKPEIGNEFLRLLSHGMPITCALVDLRPSVAVTSVSSEERGWCSHELLIYTRLGFHA